MSLLRPTFWEKVKIVWGEIVASFKTVSVALAVGLVCGGCLNIVGHATGDKPYKPYESTKGCARSIAEAFCEKPEWHSGSAGEAGMAHAVSIVTLPIMLLILPFEAVADTVTFPYDYFKN